MDLMLRDLNLDSLSLLYYSAPTSACLIFTGFMLFERATFDVAVFTPDLCFMLLLNGLLAFSLNIAVIYLISSTSGMVLTVSGPMKDILIVMMSVAIFGAPVTGLQVGSVWFTNASLCTTYVDLNCTYINLQHCWIFLT